MNLVVYGSFNCPYSYLASLRTDRLVAAGVAKVEWRAVVHDPDVPPVGTPVSGELADMLDREFEEIRGLLTPGESYPARRPAIQPNTTAAVAGYCSLSGAAAERLRRELFEAYWVGGADIGDRPTLDRLGCPASSPGATMRTWQSQWEKADSAVPMLILPGGEIAPGVEALNRLAKIGV